VGASNHAGAASRTGTLKRLCRDLSAGEAPLADRVGALGLAGVELEDWEEVVDPGGSEVDVFVESRARGLRPRPGIRGKLH